MRAPGFNPKLMRPIHMRRLPRQRGLHIKGSTSTSRFKDRVDSDPTLWRIPTPMPFVPGTVPTFPAPTWLLRPSHQEGPRAAEGLARALLEAYRTRGGVHRAAAAAGVHPETVRQERHRDPAFDQQVLEAARVLRRDLVRKRPCSPAPSGLNNPVGFIVRRLESLAPE